MSLRLVNRVAGVVSRIPSALMSRASNPKNILQCRRMSKKKTDGTCKRETKTDSQFFEGCFTEQGREPCPAKKLKQKASTCKKTGQSGPCKQGK